MAPSLLQPKTPRDLETICLKCLEKDITRRYPDVLALAEDLRRFRAGEPILARPVSQAERLWRWCLRNQRVASLSGAVALLLVIVAAGSAIAAVTLGQAKALADEKRQEAERKQKLAVIAARAANEQNRSAVEADVELIILLNRTLRDVPAIQKIREETLDKTITRLDAAADAMTKLRRDIDWDPKDEAHNWRSLSRAHQAQASVSLSRNKTADAMEQFRQAEELMDRAAAADPDDLDIQVNLLRFERQRGNVSWDRLRDIEGAQKYFKKALEISRACLAKKPDHDPYKSELANSLGKLAGSEMALGHLKEAHKLYREEIDVRNSFSPALANDWETRRELASHYADLAALTVRTGDPVEGQRLYDECASIREKVVKERPDSWPAKHDLALTYNQQGPMRFPRGSDAKAARGYHRKALEIFRQRAEVDPADAENKHMLAQTLYCDATCALHSGDNDGADNGYKDCLRICQELAAEAGPKGPQTDLMLALARCGEHAKAAKIAEDLVVVPPKDEAIYVQAACGYALAAGAAAKNADLVKRYTDKAFECLHKAKQRGWADAFSLEIDTDLEPIRNDPQFKALLDELRPPGGKRT